MTFQELHTTYQELDPASRPGQSFISKRTLMNLLEDRFIGVEHGESTYTETFDSCLDFFMSIKRIGANKATNHSKRKDPNFIQEVMTFYEANYRLDNKVFATYHSLFFKAYL
jgi:hypothetical protein